MGAIKNIYLNQVNSMTEDEQIEWGFEQEKTDTRYYNSGITIEDIHQMF